MRKGSKHTPEALAKIKANNVRTGNKFTFTLAHRQNLSLANKGQVPWIKGRNQTDEHLQRRLQSRIKNGTTSKVTAPRGESHYLWKKDRTTLSTGDSHERGSPAHREWSLSVKRRDGWICRISDQKCIDPVVAHHIKSWRNFPDLRYQITNGITLCHAHHPRTRENEQRMIPKFLAMVSNTA